MLAARKDIPDAQYQLSWFYANGKGTSQSLRETVYWIQKAAHKGHVVAMRSMGMLSYSGLGMPENKVDAFKWFEKAASAGDAEAQYHLGMSYMAGKGTEKDGKKGEEWLYRAALQNQTKAQDYLSVLYVQRLLDKKNRPGEIEQARQWLENAARRTIKMRYTC